MTPRHSPYHTCMIHQIPPRWKKYSQPAYPEDHPGKKIPGGLKTVRDSLFLSFSGYFTSCTRK